MLRLSGRKYVEIIDEHGCVILDSILLRVKQKSSGVFFPTVFSPNGDSINDIWGPIFNAPSSRLISISIYDRWGEQVYQNILDIPWKGDFNGQKTLPGVYVYYVVFAIKLCNPIKTVVCVKN